jgi:predicted DNA-binding protein
MHDRKTLPVRIPAEMHEELKHLASDLGRTMGDLIADALLAHLPEIRAAADRKENDS